MDRRPGNSAGVGGDHSGPIIQGERVSVRFGSRLGPWIVALGIVVAGLVVFAVVNADDEQPAADPPRDVLLTKTGYRLVPSSDPLSNQADKVDLDTGCPGWGPTPVRVGRNRCGDLADLIIEDDELHTPEYKPAIAVAPEGACEDAEQAVSSVPLAELRAGAVLCVRTDRENVARVRIDGVGPEGVEISFQTWKA